MSLTVIAMVLVATVVPAASSPRNAHDEILNPTLVQNKVRSGKQKLTGSIKEKPQVPIAIGSSTIGTLLNQIRLIHPLVIALGQVFVVLGVCLLLTENRELELYFKIEFRPPKTDILN